MLRSAVINPLQICPASDFFLPPAPRQVSESLQEQLQPGSRLPGVAKPSALSVPEFWQEASGVGVRPCPSLLSAAQAPCVPSATAALAGTGQGTACRAAACSAATRACTTAQHGLARHGTGPPGRERGWLDKMQYFRKLKHLLLQQL